MGFLKLDVEGMDEVLIKAYVKYLSKHKACWADGIEFEFNTYLTSSDMKEVLAALEGFGYRRLSSSDTFPIDFYSFLVFHKGLHGWSLGKTRSV